MNHTYRTRIASAIFTMMFAVLLFNCSHKNNNDDLYSGECDEPVIISSEKYNSAHTDHITINNLDINQNCLNINYSSSGCSGNSWQVKLIDSGEVMESYPPQRNLILSLKNDEMCEAYITKKLSVDISELQVDGDKVILNITNTGDNILYEY